MEQCPVCMANTPDNDHLMREYREMLAAQFGMFKHNAVAAQNKVADMLLKRGIKTIPNIFGAIPVRHADGTAVLEEDKPHPDACLCDECARDRFVFCGYED